MIERRSGGIFHDDQVLFFLAITLGSAGGAEARDEAFGLEQELLGGEVWSRIIHEGSDIWVERCTWRPDLKYCPVSTARPRERKSKRNRRKGTGSKIDPGGRHQCIIYPPKKARLGITSGGGDSKRGN